MNWISHYFKSFRIISANYRGFSLYFAGVSALFILCSVLGSFLPVLLRNAANTFGETDNAQAQFIFFAGCYAALWTLSQVLSNIRGVFSAWILAKCDATLYETIIGRIFNYSHHKQQRLDPGYVVAEINRSAGSFSMVTVGVFWTLVPIAVEIAVAIGVLYTVMGTLYALLFLLACILLSALAIYIAKSSSHIHTSIFEADNKLSSYTVERLGRVYDIKLNNTQAKEFAAGREFFEHYVKTIRHANLHMGIRIACQGLAIGAVLAFFVILSGLHYRSTFTAGDFVMVVGYITLFTLQLHLLAGTLINLQAHLVSLDAGIKYIEEPVQASHFPQQRQDQRGFVLAGVSLTKDGRVILDHIECAFGPGVNIIAGGSGAGKTTLINTLLGFEEDYTGNAYYQGQRINAALSEYILSEVAVAPQKPILIPGTFRDNLLYGAENVSPHELREVAELLGFSRKHSDIDELLATAIDLSGSGLSGGERQRIAIGRAILRGKSTVILDEPTAALDESTARRMVEWLARNIRCLIIVTHDEQLKSQYGVVVELSERPT